MSHSDQLLGYVTIERCSHTPSMPSAIEEALKIFTAKQGFLSVKAETDFVITVTHTDTGWKVAFSQTGP